MEIHLSIIMTDMMMMTTHRDDLCLGDGGSDAPEEQRTGPVERPGSGRLVLLRLLVLLLHLPPLLPALLPALLPGLPLLLFALVATSWGSRKIFEILLHL